MKKTMRIFFLKWMLLALFGSYITGITFFTHTHIVNGITYVHSHPFKKGKKKQHAHTEKQLYTLAHFYHTSINFEVVPHFEFAALSRTIQIYRIKMPDAIQATGKNKDNPLRAPPLASSSFLIPA